MRRYLVLIIFFCCSQAVPSQNRTIPPDTNSIAVYPMWNTPFNDPNTISLFPFSPLLPNQTALQYVILPGVTKTTNVLPGTNPPIIPNVINDSPEAKQDPHEVFPQGSSLRVDSIWTMRNALVKQSGVTNYDSAKAENGVTLLDLTVSSLLIDMNGSVLAKFPFGLTHLSPDGNIIANMGGALVKFDSDLNLLWKTWATPHHEITTDENGTIYLLTHDTHRFMGLQVNFDVLEVYSVNGKLVYRWCVFDHLEEFISVISRSAYLNNLHDSYDPQKGVIKYISQDPEMFFFHLNPVTKDTSFELTHMNSIQALPENEVSKKIPAFKKGNLLLSFNPYSCYGILDTASGKIEWAGYLPERTTLHTPSLTKSGTILVFQNSTDSNSLWLNKENDACLQYLYQRIPPKIRSRNIESRNWVSLTEYDPVRNIKVWEYTAKPKELLLAGGLGNVQRLSNGNTLACIANDGGGSIILEISPEKKIVWRYMSPEKDIKTKIPLTFYRAKRLSFDLAKKIIPEFN